MNRHATDMVSLVFGLVFVGLGLVGVVDRFSVTLADVRWLLPGLLIVFGLVLVVTSGRGGTEHGPSDEQAADGEVVRADDPR